LELVIFFLAYDAIPASKDKRNEVTNYMVSKYNTERKYKEGQQNRKDIFEFIENYINLHQYSPSNREIEEAT